jgi:hypothetical protein
MTGSTNIAFIAALLLVVAIILCVVWWFVPKRQTRGFIFEKEVHRARIMDKMGARSLPELVRMAIAVEWSVAPGKTPAALT